MASLNKCQIIGHSAADAEMKYTPQGTAVTNIRVGVTERWTDKEGGKQQRTEWFSVTFWAKLAEIAGKYIKKGSSVYIEGKLKTRSWQDDQGNTRYSTSLEAMSLQLLGERPSSAVATETSPPAAQPEPKPEPKPQTQVKTPVPAQNTAKAPDEFDGGGEPDFGNIPF